MGAPNKGSFEWDEPAIAVLTRLWADGLSGSEIASTMGNGLSRCAVLGKVSRIGLPRRKWSKRIVRKKLGRRVTNIPAAERLDSPSPAPADTRTFEQRIFGDPLPGRSALDERRRRLSPVINTSHG